jgi:hypothetical protein
VSATPTRCSFQPYAARYIARNGPTPVCTSASRKVSQSPVQVGSCWRGACPGPSRN